jgi:hypothetical protein
MHNYQKKWTLETAKEGIAQFTLFINEIGHRSVVRRTYCWYESGLVQHVGVDHGG